MILIPATRTIPAGAFTMGELPDDKFANATERPAHPVRIAAFNLGVHPITNAEFRAHDATHDPTAAPDHPVVRVSWHQATAYCEWLRDETAQPYRLLSEAEWEYAATAGQRTAYPRGADLTPADANYLYSEQGHRVGPGHPTPIGAYPTNPFGIHDLHGNVNEWTADPWHRTYEGAPTDGTAWIANGDPDHRVIRGGAWDQLPRLLRATNRDAQPTTTQSDNLGFRIAATWHRLPAGDPPNAKR